jgi:hypothetical protein
MHATALFCFAICNHLEFCHRFCVTDRETNARMIQTEQIHHTCSDPSMIETNMLVAVALAEVGRDITVLGTKVIDGLNQRGPSGGLDFLLAHIGEGR